MRERVRQAAGRLRRGLDERVVPELPQVARTTAAVVVAYLLARLVSPDPRPLLAPLAALLVVQATVYETVSSALQRVAAVVVGVLVAIGAASLGGFTWWMLALVVSSALVLARLLALEQQALEVPISAMLVLAVVGSSESAAVTRIGETLLGAAVGVVVNFAAGPPPRTGSAAEEIAGITEDMGALLHRVADELRSWATHEQADRWMADARAIAVRLPRADELVEEAERSLRLNPRASPTLRAGWSLRPRLDALVWVVLSLVPLLQALADRVRQEPEEEPAYTAEVRAALVRWLDQLAGAVEAFGRVAASGTTPSPIASAALDEALEEARRTRVRLADLLLLDSRADPQGWETHGALVLHGDRLLEELDVDRYARARETWLRERLPLVERSEEVAQQVAQQVAEGTRRLGSRLVPGRWRGRRRSRVSPPGATAGPDVAARRAAARPAADPSPPTR